MRVTREVGHKLDWFARGTQVRYRLPGFATSEFLADCDSEEHARLIAAAPELLEAAQSVLYEYDTNSGEVSLTAMDILKAAISKAEEGQS